MKQLLIVLIFFPLIALPQKTKRALFVGNSYTYVNNLPQLTADIALSKGDTLIFDSNTPGGYTLQMHSTNSTTLSKIAQGNWDYVILQAQSQEPSFDPAQVANDVLPYAHQLDSLVHAASPCAETVFYMTWGRKNGDASNCGAYPPVCTYVGMQERLRQSYLLMGQQNNASVCPIGCVWREIRNFNPSYDLYQADESHPSAWGSYVAACSFYEMLFQNRVEGSNYYFTLPSADAMQIQQVTSDFFSDSLSTYAIAGNIPFANFNYSMSGSSVSFANTSINGNLFQWDFGDGTTSSSTNPNHTYSVAGIYAVSLEVTGSCMNDIYIDTIVMNAVSLDEQNKISSDILYDGKNLIAFCNKLTCLNIFTVDGKLLYKVLFSEKMQINIADILSNGIYLVEMVNPVEVKRKRISVNN